MTDRYDADALIGFAAAAFQAAGMDADKAAVTARLLVEADMMGHTTHGLHLAPGYLGALDDGTMAGTGQPEVVSDRGAALTWDGHRLPGVWLTATAMEEAVGRAGTHGTATIAIRRSHHIACLAAFLPIATAQGMMAILACSDPNAESIAPFGGLDPVFTPDPIAVGIPTDEAPILIDTSASITTNGLTGRLHQEGRRLPHAWVMDAEGRPSDDPAVLFTDPPGTILPTGGLDHGHKGYALALMIEALTHGLGGHGRADAKEGWGASVFVQVLDPRAFAGADAFTRQTGHTAAACRASRPRDPDRPVRLPGQGALAARDRARTEGVVLYDGVLQRLADKAAAYGLTPPTPLA
jgi:LDH2 family malate/lactate/ureidoglycolate dehydrogenase